VVGWKMRRKKKEEVDHFAIDLIEDLQTLKAHFDPHSPMMGCYYSPERMMEDYYLILVGDHMNLLIQKDPIFCQI